MKKNMYSLMLVDEVVRVVDRVAHEQGTSRSNLVNRILAEYLSVMTPEMQIQQMLRQAEVIARETRTLQVQPQPSGTMLVLKSSVNFKYNPVIRYSVEIQTGTGEYLGEFRAVSRSKNEVLLSRLSMFFELWVQLEQNSMPRQPGSRSFQYEIGSGRFRRKIELRGVDQPEDCEELGEAVGRYIQVFDDAMQLFFAAPHGVDLETYEAMNRRYRQYLESARWAV